MLEHGTWQPVRSNIFAMNRPQNILLRLIGVIVVASLALLVYYNLSPNYVDEQGVLVEEFWALGLASFGLVGSVFAFLSLLVWMSVSKKRAR